MSITWVWLQHLPLIIAAPGTNFDTPQELDSFGFLARAWTTTGS